MPKHNWTRSANGARWYADGVPFCICVVECEYTKHRAHNYLVYACHPDGLLLDWTKRISTHRNVNTAIRAAESVD